jgi:hypothetical protein
MDKQHGNGILSPRRFGHLLLREVAGSYRGVLIAMAAVAGAFIVISLLMALGHVMTANGRVGGSPDFLLGFFRNMLFLGGFILTSMAFRELRQNAGGIFYLTLPGSLFEKLLSKLLLTSVGYALGCALFFTATSAVSQLLTTLLFGSGNGIFDPLDPLVLKMMALYLVTQSIFLLGSVWFRKLAFLKTILWIVLFSIAAGIVFSVAARFILARPFAAGGQFGMGFGGGRMWGMLGQRPQVLENLGGLRLAMQIVLYAVLAPVCWLAAYFKLGETEV